MLRKTVGGQASESRHILGKAADVHFPDVPLKNLRYSALIREKGGVGYYPTSALPFVHVDTDRVRSWPRLPRMELALLFPNGKTQHQPADGEAITMDDVRVAQARHKDLAIQVAEFHGLRNTAKPSVAVAALVPPKRQPTGPALAPATVATAAPVAQAPAPRPTLQLAEAPRLVDRPSQITATRPSDSDRKKLTELAALASAYIMPQSASGADTGAPPPRRDTAISEPRRWWPDCRGAAACWA